MFLRYLRRPSIDIQVTFYGDLSQGNPSVGRTKHNSRIQRFWTYIYIGTYIYWTLYLENGAR